MTYENFLNSIKEMAPGCMPGAIPLWRDFAEECVDRGQFVHFEQTADKTAAVEKWLDALHSGFQAVREGCGPETTAAMVGLSLETCCLYPGEMMQAALCLESGGNAKQVLDRINSGEIDCTDIFSPISRRDAEGRRSVRDHLKSKSKCGRRRKDKGR